MGKNVISQNAEIHRKALGNLNRSCSKIRAQKSRRAKKARLLVFRKLFALI